LANERLLGERELERRLAMRIQTSVLPSSPRLHGLDIAARMIPADDVGGDYYDVIQTDRTGWIAIGDVSGHGFEMGMIMLMTQSALSALVRASPNAAPGTILRQLNATL